MNLLEDLARIYDLNEDSVGIVMEKNAVLLPLYHAAQNTQITVTINMRGEFVSAITNAPEEEFTVIPTTLDSSCRASNNAPHGCGDRVDYLSGNLDEFFPEIRVDEDKTSRNKKRNEIYLEQLREWAESPYATPKVQAIYDYEAKGCLLNDLYNSHIFPNAEGEELSSKMKINKISIDTCAIRFRVECDGPDSIIMEDDDYIAETWLDKEMSRSWIEFYGNKVAETFPKDYCYVSGKYTPITTKHSNGIRANSDFAKLISANENGMIVFSGTRFHDASEAMVVGYETSLKAHSALRWMISLQGRRSGGNILLAWDDFGKPVYVPYEMDTPTTYGYAELPVEEKLFATSEEYMTFLRQKAEEYEEENGTIHFLELDSSNPGGDLKGRIAVLDYQVYSAKDYYENVLSWHSKYYWNIFRGKENRFTGSPSIYDYVNAAYGVEQKTGLSVTSKSMFTKQYNRLVKCVILGCPIPDDTIRQLVSHASNPMKYQLSRARIWTIACAAINGKEKMDIMLDKECLDRDYLFGRVLALANHVERQTFTETDRGRETNAIRFMADYVNHPATTWGLLFQKLQPYFKKLNRSNPFIGEYYRKEINAVVEKISAEDFNDKRLGNKYLLGFSSQSAALVAKREKKNETNENEDAFTGGKE